MADDNIKELLALCPLLAESDAWFDKTRDMDESSAKYKKMEDEYVRWGADLLKRSIKTQPDLDTRLRQHFRQSIDKLLKGEPQNFEAMEDKARELLLEAEGRVRAFCFGPGS